MSSSSPALLPNLVIAGVTKAGTTSLHYYLTQHPDIASADTKEVDHYAPLIFGSGTVPSLEDYASHFRGSGDARWRLDASPRYFTGGKPLIEKLDADLPGARVMICLRDPVARMWSGFTYKHSRAQLSADTGFDEFVAACAKVAESGLGADPEGDNFRTLATGRYTDFLPDWFATLGDRLRIVFFDDLVGRPIAEMDALYSWLGLDPGPAETIDFGVRNRTVSPRSQTLRSLAVKANARAGHLLGDSAARRAVRATYLRFNAKDSGLKMTVEQRQQLDEIFAPSLAALRELLTARGYSALPPWLAERTT